MQITNTQAGPRGLNTTSGPVLLEPGQTLDDPEVSAAELASAKRTGWFEIKGYPAEKQEAEPKLSAEERKKAAADLLKQIDDMHFQTFRKHAGEILGPDALPDRKDEIVEALKKAAA